MSILGKFKGILKKGSEKPVNSNSGINKSIVDLFKEKKNTIHKAIAKWYGEPGIDFVLVPVLYAFFDYSLFLHQKDRAKYSKLIEDYIMRKEYKTNDKKDYHSKVLSVFAEAINGNSVRGDWWLSAKRPTNPVFASMLFLGDLLLNNDMVTNYKKAPAMIIDSDLLIQFAQIMINQVYPEMMNAFELINKLN